MNSWLLFYELIGSRSPVQPSLYLLYVAPACFLQQLDNVASLWFYCQLENIRQVLIFTPSEFHFIPTKQTVWTRTVEPTEA